MFIIIFQQATCQAAVFVCSYVRAEKFKLEEPDAFRACKVVAGFSAGELSALAVSGALSYPDACAVVRERGLAMRHACQVAGNESGMATVVGPSDEAVEAALGVVNEELRAGGALLGPHCERHLYVAHHLFPGGKNVGGTPKALDRLKDRASALKLKAIKPLKVAGQ
jgi:[acyl-carrier-protein] S-malonyltransferase